MLDDEVEPGRRRPYHSPVLVDYGPVAKLTKGSGGSLVDGIMNDKK